MVKVYNSLKQTRVCIILRVIQYRTSQRYCKLTVLQNSILKSFVDWGLSWKHQGSRIKFQLTFDQYCMWMRILHLFMYTYTTRKGNWLCEQQKRTMSSHFTVSTKSKLTVSSWSLILDTWFLQVSSIENCVSSMKVITQGVYSTVRGTWLFHCLQHVYKRNGCERYICCID